jgi:hypothetical protein
MIRPEARAALEQLEQDDGRLTAADVVEAARPADSVLHRYIFAKDDKEALEQYRLHLAERLIARYYVEIQVVKATGKTEQLLIRGYQSERRAGNAEAPRGSYKRAGSMTPLEQNILLQRMNREVRSLRLRYGHLQEFWSAIAELNDSRPGDQDPGQEGTAAASG